MIGFLSRVKGRGTAPLPAAGAGGSAGPAAGKDVATGAAAAGRGATSGYNAAASAGAAATTGNTSSRSSTIGADSGRMPGSFIGAALPVCGIDVLIIIVHPWVLANIHEANLYVVAFHERFRRTIVLAAQGCEGPPCFYGPTQIIRVLQGLPFEMIPWRRLLFGAAPPPARHLPLPPPRGDSGRIDAEHIGADSAASTHRIASIASTTPAAGAHRADSPADTTPHRRESRARRADRTTAH